ncbi:elongation factor P [Chloroflexota bacterium]
MIGSGELRKGIAIELDGQLYYILDYQHIKVGRGSAQIRLKLRDLRAGHTIERTFQAGEKFNRARLEQRSVQYLYSDNDLYYFMDMESYEQIALSSAQLGDAMNYLKEEMLLAVLIYGEEPIGVEMPITADLKVVETTPGFKGDTASGGSKPARLETGISVQVPLFVSEGDTVRVDTRSGTYMERAG